MNNNLKFEQHYFTASKYKAGYFTIDSSPGLSKEEVTELEKRGIYAPPVNLPTAPSVLEISNLFPVNLAFFKLRSSGRFVFLHSVYTGIANHSPNRFGNYFSHSLVLSQGELNFPVKLLFDNVKFETKLSFEDDEQYTPKLNGEQLIVIDISENSLKDIFDKFKDFFSGGTNRLNVLSKIFDLIIEGKIAKPGYNITIQDVKDNLSWWVFAVNYFLPRALANKISLASYVDDPSLSHNFFTITGIVPECDINSFTEKYFCLVKVSEAKHYTPSQPYTKTLVKILDTGIYTEWEKLLRELDEFGVDEINQQLNTPIDVYDFKKELHQRTLEDLLRILDNMSSNPSKKNDIITYIKVKNSKLFYEYVVDRLTKECKNVDFIGKRDAFYKEYESSFDTEQNFSKEYLSSFIESYLRLNIGILEFKAAFWALSHINLNYLDDKACRELFEKAEEYFNREESLQSILSHSNVMAENMGKRKFLDKIKGFLGLPNTEAVLLVDKLSQHIQKNGLVSTLQQKETEFMALKAKYKKALIVFGLNIELKKNTNKGCYYGIDFGQYIAMVKKYFKEDESRFWKKFFEDNEGYNRTNMGQYYTMSYLKKIFAAYVFLKMCTDINPIKELNLDNYIDWLDEHIREHAETKNEMDVFVNYKEMHTS